MSTKRILSRSVATLLALTPFLARGAADTLSGASPAWGTVGSWSLGAIPGTGDNAIVTATGTVDVRGSTLGGLKEIQDLTISSTAAVSLTNNSSSTDMLLALNGLRGAGVPLISTVGDFAYAITGPGTNATPHPLGLQLRASGEISVAANILTISSIISEFGGQRSLSKTGAGRLILSAANTFTGGVTISAGILEATVNGALGSGPAVINGGTLEINLASATLTANDIELNAGGQLATRGTVTLNNNVTVNGGTLATRSTDGGVFAGTMHVIAPSFVNLRSYTTPANSQSLTISGLLTGSSSLTINGNDPQTNGAGKALILTNTGNTYSGTFNISNNQILRSAPAVTGNTLGTGTVNLNGGTLQIRADDTGSGGVTFAYNNNVTVAGSGTINVDRIATGQSNTTQFGTLNFTAGGILHTTGANLYAVRFGGATTLSPGAVFDPTTAPVVLAGSVGGAGELTKTGSGDLQLNAANNYSGETNLNEGRFVLNGSITSSPRINVNAGTFVLNGFIAGTTHIHVKAGATFDATAAAGGFTLGGAQILSGDGAVTGGATVASGGRIEAGDTLGAGTLTMSNLTLGTAAGHTSTLAVNPGASALPLSVTTLNGLVANGGAGSVTINVGGGSPSIGTHVLVGYSGAIVGGFASFQLGTLPTPRLAATLVNSGASIDLNVTGTDAPFWSGKNGTEWSVNLLAPLKNWVLNTALGAPTDFLVNDSVTFDDIGTGAAPAVNVSVADVAPSAVLFSNATKPYTITGTKAIAGTTGLAKTGAAKVTIANTNSFTGPVSIAGTGTVSVPAVADAGVNSPLGAGAAITLDDGTLEFTGASGGTNRPVILGAGGGTLANPLASVLTLSGVLSGGALTKTGAGKVILAGAANTYALTTISAGTLQIGNGISNGTPGTGTIGNDGTLAFDNPTAQTVTNEILGTGALTKTGAGILVLSGGSVNSCTGPTTVSGGNLILSKPSGFNAIGGDVFVEVGGTVSYGTTAGQLQDHIADSAHITINGGTFGSGASDTQALPTAGITDTVAGVTVNSGTFLSGRNATVNAFTLTGLLKIVGGTVLVQRGGGISANAVEFTGGSLNLDGGSTTPGQQSRLNVGAGGLTMAGTTITFNAGPSALTATSTGSLVMLGGDVTSLGTSSFVRQNPTVPSAVVDLGGVRTFTVTGTLSIGSTAVPVALANGALTKAGTGTLVLAGASTYAGGTAIDAGTLSIDGDAALGDPAGGVTIANNAVLLAAATVGSARAFALGAGGGQIDTNGQTVTLAVGGSIAGTTLTKTGNGTLTLAGTQTFAVLNANGGVTNVNSALGTGTSALHANATVHLNASQTLAALTIANGVEVTFGDGLTLVSEPEKFGAPALVPEPGALGLLAAGALGCLGRRRRGPQPR